MVFAAAENVHGAVELLAQDDAHQLVRKGHLRKGQLPVGACLDFIGKPVRAADDECDIGVAVGRKRVELRNYYFNPTVNDTNLEYDSKRNLLLDKVAPRERRFYL